MSLPNSSPINILQRLQELKIWQQNHEELLKKPKNNTSTASDYQSIDGLSAFDSTLPESPLKSTPVAETQIISPPAKCFREMLEAKLAEDPGPPQKVRDKPKKPFLRKRTGLQRFGIATDQAEQPHKDTPMEITPLRAPDLAIRPKATWCKALDEHNPIQRINEMVEMEPSPQPSEQTIYEKALEKELLIFEALEEKADNSSFCSTNSTVMRILASTPSKKTGIFSPPVIPEEKHVHWGSGDDSDTPSAIESHLPSKDIHLILQRLQTITHDSPPEAYSTSSSSSSSISSNHFNDDTLKPQMCDAAVATDPTRACPICGDDRSDLESRLHALKTEHQRVTDLQNDLKRKHNALERDYQKRKRDLEDDHKDFMFAVEDEKRKLVKERNVYQTYLRDSQSRPTKKEREETSNLKQELADLRETLKMNQSKNGMTQARLRNVIKQLEKDNGRLKEEVEKLTKDKAKMTATQKIKRKSGETKILNEINKNITKLTEKTFDTKQVDVKETNNKENDDSLLEMDGGRGDSPEKVAKQYENTFRGVLKQNTTINESRADRSERLLDDGTKETKYSNGNVKVTSPDGNLITVRYFNGDFKETNLYTGTIKYHFVEKNIQQTSFPDGTELTEFPDGHKVKTFPDGRTEETSLEGIVTSTSSEGVRETSFPDGSHIIVAQNGDKVLILPNGQKEYHTRENMRREYPDGTIKILFPDGSQETRYANGRIRKRDASGALILDSQ